MSEGSARPNGGRSSAALALAVLTTLWGSSAAAGDWSAKARFSETVEVNDNLALDEDKPGTAVGLLSAASFDLQSHSPTLRLAFLTDAGHQHYWGDGRPEDNDRFVGSLRGILAKRTRQADYELNSLLSFRPGVVDELSESGAVAEEADQFTATNAVTVAHKIDHDDSLQWRNAATVVEFSEDDDDLEPYFDLATSAAWLHQLSERTETRTTLSAEYYDADDDEDTESLIFRALTGLTRHMTRRVVFRADAGVGVVETSSDDGLGGRDHETSASFVANAGVDMKLKRSLVGLSAAHDFIPSNRGELQRRLTLGAAVAYRVNEDSSVELRASYGYQIGTGAEEETSEAFTVSPSYARRFGRDWETRLSYRFTRSQDDDGTATTNAAYVTLSRNLVLIPED